MITLNGKKVEFQTFPNKETRLDLDKSLLREVNKVIWKFEANGDIFELLQFDAVMTQMCEDYNLYISYMPYSRMDRIEQENTAYSLEIMACIINMLSSVHNIYIFDPHSPKTLDLLTYEGTLNAHCTKELDFSLAKHVLDETADKWIVFPDAGAAKRYNMDDYENVIICEKKRDFKTGQILGISAHIKKQEGTASVDSDLYIIDDICSKGGTFIGCLDAISNDLNLTPRNKTLIVSHLEKMAFEGDIFSRFDTVTSTDSMWVDLVQLSKLHNSKKARLFTDGITCAKLNIIPMESAINIKNL